MKFFWQHNDQQVTVSKGKRELNFHEHGGTRYHDHQHGGTRYHDHQHGGTRYHDHQHGGTRYHDHQHGGTRYHDHQHGGTRYHDHQLVNAIRNAIHDRAHVMSCIAGEIVDDKGIVLNQYIRFGGQYDEVQNGGYFYAAGPHDPQWGYLKIVHKETLDVNGRVIDNAENDEEHKKAVAGNDDVNDNLEDVILFVNDTGMTTDRGEENRKVFYRIKTVHVSLGGSTVDMAVAHNFDVVPPNPVLGKPHSWKNAEDLREDDWVFGK